MVGQTDAGETIYEARSARLVLRAESAHFNRLVRCSKCGREAPGRAVLSAAELDQPPQAVMCTDCAEAATEMSARPGPPAEPVARDEPAVTDAQAEMYLDAETLEDAEVSEPVGGEAEGRDVPPVDHVELADHAGSDEDELTAVDDDRALLADATLMEDEMPAPPEALGGLGDVDPPAFEDDEPAMVGADPDGHEPLAPVTTEPAYSDAPPEPPEELRDDHLTELDPRTLAIILRLNERAAVQDELNAALQSRVEDLEVALKATQGKKESDRLRRQVDLLGERLEELQGTIDAEWARTKSETATLAQTITELGERVVRLAEQAGDTAGAEDERVAALEEKVDDVAARLETALESQRRELQEGLREGLADVLSAVPSGPAAAGSDDGRLRTLERQLQQSRTEVADLNELHAALDAGLGALRAELGDVRTTLTRLADSKADLDDRLETFVRMSLVPEGDKGRKARKAAESNLGTLSAAVQDLLREQRQLKDSFAGVERASDAATAAAARASTQASTLGPLRSEMKLLHQELVEQQETLDELRRTVESLRPPATASPPSPPAVRPAKKTAPAKRATAKAAIAKAAAAQAAAAKKAPPAAKKAPRAKKA